jgi:bifunctional non-homologous end joining protein LigD
MNNIRFPSNAVPAGIPARIRLPVVSPSARPPEGEGWLHEIKHDGHRLVAILDGRGGLKLISRRGYDRTPLFRAPFVDLLLLGREIVLDGEMAVPDDRGVTHISNLDDAIAERRPDRLAYFAFDLLHLDGHDFRGCRIDSIACEGEILWPLQGWRDPRWRAALGQRDVGTMPTEATVLRQRCGHRGDRR